MIHLFTINRSVSYIRSRFKCIKMHRYLCILLIIASAWGDLHGKKDPSPTSHHPESRPITSTPSKPITTPISKPLTVTSLPSKEKTSLPSKPVTSPPSKQITSPPSKPTVPSHGINDHLPYPPLVLPTPSHSSEINTTHSSEINTTHSSEINTTSLNTSPESASLGTVIAGRRDGAITSSIDDDDFNASFSYAFKYAFIDSNGSENGKEDKKLISFIKLLHSKIDSPDSKSIATHFLPIYIQLCAAVSDCDYAIGELFMSLYAEVQLELHRMDKLHHVLHRLKRLRGKQFHHRDYRFFMNRKRKQM